MELLIRKVRNGYVVFPDGNLPGMVVSNGAISVFESFDNLVKFLDEKLNK